MIEAHFQKIMSAAETNIGDRNAIAAALLDVKKDEEVFYHFKGFSVVRLEIIQFQR